MSGRRAAAGTLAAACVALAACATAPVDHRSAGASFPPGWSEFTFPGKQRTVYRPAQEDGRFVVYAEARASASMLRRSLALDAARVAQVEFSWRVDELMADADLGVAERSDSPVRVAFAFEGDRAKLSMRNRAAFDLAEALTGEAPPYATLMYVWDTRAAPESLFHAHRTDRVRKIVLESGPARCGQWLQYRRDLMADFRRAFGEEPGRLVGVAYMSDSDNTGGDARARYGEVRLLGPDGTAL